ncbi:PAS domain S-box protein [Clostridium chromiireducens]|uniref:histidine kinase n=1 Tax=Clostridium chromiireducens TaxID=225345 RepID=A0A964W3Z6_9CLOT|nr:MASE3 domain-containing protein [Clostridium chromiireducens]MVX66036.1 PAS domain S-box protein [Clostridium chromiireducens]
MYKFPINRKKVIEFLHIASMCIFLYLFSKQSYVTFHTIIEIITVVLGLTLMLIALGTTKICDNNYFHVLAIIFGFIGVIDLFHVLTYKGISAFNNDSNMSVQLSILGTYYECIMLTLSSIYINKKLNFNKVFILNFAIVIFGLSSIIIVDIFPNCYIEGTGLTFFHEISEYIFSLCFLSILFRIIKSKIEIVKENKVDLIMASIFQMTSFLLFTSYNDIYGGISLVGHLFKILAYYYGFKVIFKCIVVNPYSILFKKLNHKVSELESVNKNLIKANQKAHTIEQLHEKFINFIPDGILVVREKKIESANKRFLNMLEINDDKKLLNMNFIDIIDSSYLEIFQSRVNNMDKHILEKPQQYEFIWENKRKWFEVTSLIVNDESGEYLISTIRDIEDRKKAEEAEQLLKLKIKEETMKDEFFANMSHELRTPINVIYSALQVENNYLKNENINQPIIKYNKIIRQNCLRLIRLINNIIDTTRIETSFFKPNYNIENIVSIVEDITMSIVEYVESKKISLIFDTEIEEAYVKCDSDLIERIMLNILSNAVKYGKEGGNIEVYIHQSSEDNISILIKDDGIGIADEMKNKIFDRFLKVDTSLSRKTEGSGIGLSLVKQLVEMHNGTITFESELNCGTEFKVTFPVVEYTLEACATIEKPITYQKNIIESAEIEFSDIYY